MDQPTLTSRPPSRAPRRPSRRAPVGIAIAAAALLAVSSPGLVLAWTDYTFSSSAESQMVTLINQARASAGLPALTVASSLTDVGRWRSKDMFDRNYFSHSIPSPPGGDVFDELHRRGICYTVAGENIGVNNYPDDQTVQVAFNGWMNSSGHRALILGSGFNRIGVGAFKGKNAEWPKHYYTAVFIHTCGSATPPPTPRPTATPRVTPRPTATPHATPKPTPKPTAKATPRPTLRVTAPPALQTPHVTDVPVTEAPASTPGPLDLLVGGAGVSLWLDGLPDEPAVTEPPLETDVPFETEPADGGGIVTDGDGGSLQVVEPVPTMGLLDAIVGDVVSSFLGK